LSSGEPQLRSVPRTGSAPRIPRSDRGIAIALGLALAVALVLLIWSRTQASSRISDLEAQNATLREQLAAREALVQAQQQRLTELRTGVHGLMKLLDAPLGSPPEQP
jgi:type VI protein secretion system component VasK